MLCAFVRLHPQLSESQSKNVLPNCCSAFFLQWPFAFSFRILIEYTIQSDFYHIKFMNRKCKLSNSVFAFCFCFFILQFFRSFCVVQQLEVSRLSLIKGRRVREKKPHRGQFMRIVAFISCSLVTRKNTKSFQHSYALTHTPIHSKIGACGQTTYCVCLCVARGLTTNQIKYTIYRSPHS